MKKWFAGAIVYWYENGVLKFLLLRSRSTNPLHDWQGEQVKFPGGSNRDHPEETNPLETCRRELYEETGLRLKPGVSPESSTPEQVAEDYYKIFFYINIKDCEGRMRQEADYPEGFPDGDDRLSAPFWVLEGETDIVYKTHQPALQEAPQHIHLVG